MTGTSAKTNNVTVDETLARQLAETTEVPTGAKIGLGSRLTWDPQPLKCFSKNMRINNDELCIIIKQQFQQTFHDLRGVNMSIAQPNGHIVLELYFENNTEAVPEGKIKNMLNLVTPVTGSAGNLAQKMGIVNNRINGRTYTLNDETKILLSNFMYGGPQANKPDDKKWQNDQIVREVHIPPVNEPFYYQRNAERILLRVVGIDIRKVLQCLFGDKIVINTVSSGGDEETNYYDVAMYDIKPIKYMPDGRFVCNIEQFGKNSVEEIVARENPVPIQYYGSVTMF